MPADPWPPDFDHSSLNGRSIPAPLVALGATETNLEWHNEIGGLTFSLGSRYVKWNPWGNGVDLELEWKRLAWISTRHPAPRPLEWGADDEGQWMVTETVAGGAAVGDQWRGRPDEAISAIALGLQRLHAIPIDNFPDDWPSEVWVDRRPAELEPRPSVDQLVLVHGDACAPNTLIAYDGTWTGHVDFGDLTVGDRWADLAIASMSLDWNFGEGHQPEFFERYGVEPDEARIRYYRDLWHREA